MGYRNLYITNPARLSVTSGQLIVSDEDREIRIPIEDLDAVVLENMQSTVSVALLTWLASNKVAVFICDEKHLPAAVFLPYSQHSRQLRAEKLQLNAKKSIKKRLWQEIIKRKVKNQAIVLQHFGEEDTATTLESLASKVSSGDKENIEAQAAQKYFSALFGSEFSRREEDFINSALNYGYAIIRGAITRSIASHGLIASLGIHHKNELNGYNLADDFIEPFRPIVDLYVLYHFDETNSELTIEHKAELLNLLNLDVSIDGKLFSMSSAIELQVESFIKSLEQEQSKIILPKITKPNSHRYG